MNTNIIKIPVNYTRREYYMCLEFVLDLINSLPEEKQKELQNIDNIFGFTYESMIKLINDAFIYSKLISRKDTNKVEKLLQNIFENCSFMKNDNLFIYNDFFLMNINEKLYPINNELSNQNIEPVHNKSSSSTNLVNPNAPKYHIPKSALIEQLEKIPKISEIKFKGINQDEIDLDFLKQKLRTIPSKLYKKSENGEIILDVCVPCTDDNFDPNLIRVMIDVAIKNLNENYRKIVKTVWE